MRVLVAGANGKTGRLLVGRLADAGHEPVAMVRDANQIPELREHGAVDAVVADLTEDVSGAPDGCDAALFVAGSGSGTGPDMTIRVDLMGAVRLIEACRASAAERFVMLSAMRTDDPDEGPERLRHYLAAKMEADRWLAASGLVWTIVRPGRLTDDPGSGRIRAARHLDDYGEAPREDVAAAMAAALEVDAARRKVFEMLSGDTPIPEALAGL